MVASRGSLKELDVPSLVRAVDVGAHTGRLVMGRDRRTGEAWFERGRLIAASFGAERGLDALDAMAFSLRTGEFAFADGAVADERSIEISADEFHAHLDQLDVECARAAVAIASLVAVPRIVELSEAADRSGELLLNRDAIQLLLAVDGRRTVDDLGAELGFARTIRSLTRLADLGLVCIEAPAHEPEKPEEANGQPVAAAATSSEHHVGAGGRPGGRGNGTAWPVAETSQVASGAAGPAQADIEMDTGSRAQTPVSSLTHGLAWELVQAVLLTVVIFLGVRSLVQNFRVEGTSMEPTLHDEQLLLIDRASYLHTDGTFLAEWLPATEQGSVRYPFGGPRRGDIAVFRSPVQRNTDYVKRVIGIPGDSVLIQNGDVFVNGQRLSEPYVQVPFPRAFTFPAQGQPVVVPDGNYFVLGDNRPVSVDSHLGWFVPVESFVGRAWLSYWPPASWGLVDHEPTEVSDPGAGRDLPTGAAAPGTTREPPSSVAAVSTAAALATAVARPTTGATPATAIATPPPTATAQPQPTATPPPAIPRTALDEGFAERRPGWPDSPQSTAWFAEGVYHLAARQPGRFVAIGAPLDRPLRDVAVGGTFRKVGGPPGGYGLIVRDAGPGPRDGVNQAGRYYVLEVSDRGELGIWRRDGDTWVELIPWTPSSVVRPGNAPNELLARAVGPRLTLVVNGIEVASVEDAALAGGGVGLFVGGDGNEVTAERLVVQDLEYEADSRR